MVSLFVFCYVYGQSGEAIKFGSRVGRKASRKCLKKLPVIVSACIRPFVGLFPFNRSSRFTFLHQSHLSFSLLVAFLPCNLLHRSVSHGQKGAQKTGSVVTCLSRVLSTVWSACQKMPSVREWCLAFAWSCLLIVGASLLDYGWAVWVNPGQDRWLESFKDLVKFAVARVFPHLG